MNKNRKAIRNKPIPESFRGKFYLDPTYDPAFKELFDSEAALKDFLDGVLELDGDDQIKNLKFSFDTAFNFRTPQRKKVIVDIFAMTGTGRFLNIEMQKIEHDFFIDRVFLYKAFLMIKGKQEMDEPDAFSALSKGEKELRRYELPETISIWICDFDLPCAKGEYKDEWATYSRVALKRGESAPVFPKNKYIFLSIPNFKKSADEVKGAVDVWLYLLNHAGDGKELPNFGSEAVEEALERIRVDKADDELLSDQEKDMSLKEDYRIVLAGAKIRAQEEGRAEGRAEGMSIGEQKKAREMARALKAMGDSTEKIVAVSGLTKAEVEAL